MATASITVTINGSKALAGDQKFLVSLYRHNDLTGKWPDITKDAPLQQISVGQIGQKVAAATFNSVDAITVFERNIPISGHTMVKSNLTINSFRYKVVVTVTSAGPGVAQIEKQVDIGYLENKTLVWNYITPENNSVWLYDTNTIKGLAIVRIGITVPNYIAPETGTTGGGTTEGGTTPGGVIVIPPATETYKCPYGDFTGTYDEVIAHIKTAHPSDVTTTPTDSTTDTSGATGFVSQITSWVKNNPGIALVGLLGIVLLATSGGGGGKRETVYLPAPRDRYK